MKIKNLKNKGEGGITLIALVVTIVVLLILAGVTITFVLGEGGILDMAKEAADKTKNAIANDQADMESLVGEIANILNDGGSGGGTNPEPAGPQIMVNGSPVTLTKENVKDYLGKKVTNFKTNSDSTETVGSEYTVSTTYRLYYVDFDNKYKDGEGTIYLKAECTGNNYSLTLDSATSDDAATEKIKQLNPELYKEENGGAPTTENMQAVKWLLNTTKWESLKESVTEEVKDKINWIVGAPSLEMMMDSYNTKYSLTGETPDYSEIKAGERRRLFYRYNKETNSYGYQVGPCHNSNAEYGDYTSDNSVYTDSNIDTMYYPGERQYYWLASPSSDYSSSVRRVRFDYGGFVNRGNYSDSYAFCPLVSLKSSVQLSLEGE